MLQPVRIWVVPAEVRGQPDSGMEAPDAASLFHRETLAARI